MVAATEVSGSTFGAVNDICQRANIQFMSKSHYHELRRGYVVDAVKTEWKRQQAEVIEAIGKEKCRLAGDGRFDSPGYCSQYQCYTVMEAGTKKIVDIDVRQSEEGCRGAKMETVGMEACMDRILGEHDLKVSSITTDQSNSIGSSIRRNYIGKGVDKHSLDPWHVAKNKLKKRFVVSSVIL